MRYYFSFAITQIADVPKTTKIDPHACDEDILSPSKTTKAADYKWSATTQGMLLSAFFLGYMINIIPAGVFADLFGPKYIISLGGLLTSVMTLLTPASVYIAEWKILLPLRIIVGLAQAMVYSPMHVIVANWAPKGERTWMGAMVFAGSVAGNAMNSLMSGVTLGLLGVHWQYPFYILGTVGLLWTALFFLTVFETPNMHPRMTDEEKAKFEGSTPHAKTKKKVPWKHVVKSHPFWAMIVGHTGHYWGYTALVAEMPLFLKSVLHLDIKKNSFINAGIYILMWIISIGSGIILQSCEAKHIISKITSRRIGTTLSSTLPALGLIAAVYSGCNQELAVTLLVAGMAAMGLFYSSLKVTPIDLSPRYAGSLAALCSFIAGLVGIIEPYAFGWMTPNMFLQEWRRVMWLSFAVMVGSNLYYLYPASADVQPWDNLEEKKIEEENVPNEEKPKQ